MDAATGTGAGLMGLGAGVLITALIIWLLIGLAIGALARFLLPGPDPMSWGKTLLFGIGPKRVASALSSAAPVGVTVSP